MQRRELIILFGGAAVWPLAARAQQPALPVIGYLTDGKPEALEPYVAGLRRGLETRLRTAFGKSGVSSGNTDAYVRGANTAARAAGTSRDNRANQRSERGR
jgi:hypothetical protein